MSHLFGIPPNKANLLITSKIGTTDEVFSDLQSVGLTADDLGPVDYRGKISPARNQQQCGDCWAVSSTDALQDQYILIKNIKYLRLQPAITTQCINGPEFYNKGCGGGMPLVAGKFFEENFMPAISPNDPNCKISFQATFRGKELESCQDITSQCDFTKVPTQDRYRCIPGTTKTLFVLDKDNNPDIQATIINMKKELALKKPFVCCFFVPHDFMACAALKYNWKNTGGIYINGMYNDIIEENKSVSFQKYKENQGIKTKEQWGDITDGGHAVEVVGWGISSDTFSVVIKGKKHTIRNLPYWIVKNSWGTQYQDKGYFKYAMSVPYKLEDGTEVRFNEYTGFDIPVSKKVFESTGQSQEIGQYFGGGTSFTIDQKYGRLNFSYPRTEDGYTDNWDSDEDKFANGESESEKKHKAILFYVLILVLIALVLSVLYMIKKRK